MGLIKYDYFQTPHDIFGYGSINRVEVNFVTKQVKFRLPYTSHDTVHNLIETYNQSIQKLEENFQVIVDFQINASIKYIGKKQKDWEKLDKFIKEVILPNHQVLLEDKTTGNIDQGCWFKKIEEFREREKVKKFYDTLASGKTPSKPRLKILDKSCLDKKVEVIIGSAFLTNWKDRDLKDVSSIAEKIRVYVEQVEYIELGLGRKIDASELAWIEQFKPLADTPRKRELEAVSLLSELGD